YATRKTFHLAGITAKASKTIEVRSEKAASLKTWRKPFLIMHLNMSWSTSLEQKLELSALKAYAPVSWPTMT
ncbi:hypothetical protein, partial [Klebsiella pneumoniae]|uniref:hypothetical protein n=1 Tax=Klebsiella pneumoniae TaxID=573 RepID=UPI001C6FB998